MTVTYEYSHQDETHINRLKRMITEYEELLCVTLLQQYPSDKKEYCRAFLADKGREQLNASLVAFISSRVPDYIVVFDDLGTKSVLSGPDDGKPF
jgi:hypothetical protein